MIIAFKTDVDGVLLACSAFKEHHDAELVFAKDMRELEQKLSFTGTEDRVVRLGFTPVRDTGKLVLEVLGKRPARMSRTDTRPVQYIDLVLRHSKADPAELVQLIVSCNGSAEHLYTAKTKVARRYYNYMRDVTRAWQRMCMFARPGFVNGILTVEIDSVHDIADIFCRWLAKKNPDVPVAVISGNDAWVGNGELVGLDHFTKMAAAFVKSLHAPTSPNDDELADIDELWDVFYNSQMIESRRNRNLAKKMQPKSSAGMSKMAKADRYKVERGISNCTLEMFFDDRCEVDA
ncbi:MAG TPA: DUF4130 domain-containing protein [Methanosarcinaceae archaeon]|nr:DUF4130 domain-containing protein [Methanosarcinaceae archaeon]